MFAIRTNDSRKEAWKLLSLLSSTYNVQRLLRGDVWSGRDPWLHTESDLEQCSAQIAACIKHSREYFETGEVTTLNTSPLLHYYGALSLAKAVILSTDRDYSLASFKHHGLSMVPTSTDKNTAQTSIDEMKVTVKKGVFSALCCCIQSPCIAETEYTFREVLRVTPDMTDMYIRYYNEYSHVVPVATLYHEPGFSQFSLIARTLPDHFETVFPEIAQCTERIGLDSSPMYTADELDESIDNHLNFVRSSSGDYSEMIKPLENGIYKPFATMLLGLFILGSLVRYKPDIWIADVVLDRIGLRPVIETYLGICSTWLPIEALRLIHNIEYVFHSPGVIVYEDPLDIMNSKTPWF